MRRERRLPDRLHDPSLLESVEDESVFASPDREMAESVQEMLNQVSPASGAVLSLHYLHGMSLRETADILEISIGTAKSRLAYGLSTLREKLDMNHHDGRQNLG